MSIISVTDCYSGLLLLNFTPGVPKLYLLYTTMNRSSVVWGQPCTTVKCSAHFIMLHAQLAVHHKLGTPKRSVLDDLT